MKEDFDAFFFEIQDGIEKNLDPEVAEKLLSRLKGLAKKAGSPP
jgi:hypothetical protein